MLLYNPLPKFTLIILVYYIVLAYYYCYLFFFSTYLILAPKTARPGQDYSFSVTIKNASSDVLIQAQISGGRPYLMSNISLKLQPGKFILPHLIFVHNLTFCK